MNRFDLEDAIMAMDQLADTFNLVLDNLDSMSEDQIFNVLFGYKEMYKLRFNKMWDTYKRVHKLDEYHESTD